MDGEDTGHGPAEMRTSPETLSTGAADAPALRPLTSAVAHMQATYLRLTGGPPPDVSAAPAPEGWGRDVEKVISLVLGRAWRAVLYLDLKRAVAKIAEAEGLLFALPANRSAERRAEVTALRAACLMQQDESLAALSLIAGRGEQSSPVPDIVAALSRYGYWKLGDLDRCHAAIDWPPLVPSRRPAVQGIFDLCTQAAIELEQLRFPSAKRLARDALRLAEDAALSNGAVAALPASLLAQLLYEEGALDEAEAMLAGRLAAVKAHGTIECCLRAYTVMARLAAHRQQFNLALVILNEAETLGARRDWPRLTGTAIALQIDVLIACGQANEARKAADRLERLATLQRPGDGFVRAALTMLSGSATCQVALALGQAAATIPALRHAYDDATVHLALYRGFHVGLWLIQALAAAGEEAEAHDLLLESVKIGAAVGLYQAFLDAGAGMADLLHGLLEDDAWGARPLPPGVRPFTASLASRPLSSPKGPETIRSGTRINAHLSEQEIRVLTYISAGYSNKKIAMALTIAPETVKSHVKRIFIKLSVGTRAEAVARGEALGLIC